MYPLLTAKQITKTYNKHEKILKGITLTVMPHTFTVLLGPSGCGKTTLLNILSGLLSPTTGSVRCQGQELTTLTPDQLSDYKREHIGYIFQNYLLLYNLTVKENIEIGINPNKPALPLKELCQILEINDLLNKFPSELSSGQQQRVAIARAVIKRPDLLFCDEATGALDEANSKKVVALLQDLKKRFGLTILFVTHNKQIARTADRVITLKDGLILLDQLNQKPISAYDMVWE